MSGIVLLAVGATILTYGKIYALIIDLHNDIVIHSSSGARRC